MARRETHATVRGLLALLAVLAVLGGAFALVGFVTDSDPGFPPPSSHVVDPAQKMDVGYGLGTLEDLERIEQQTGIHVAVAIVALPRRSSTDDYAAALFRAWGLDTKANGRTALLLINPSNNTAVIKVGPGLASTLDDAVVGLIMANRIAPYLVVNGVTGAASRGAGAIVEVLRRGPAGLQASAPDQASWLEANRDRMFFRFLGGFIAFLLLGAAINVANLMGWLPKKKKGPWRVLDWIARIAGSIKVSTSESSSSSGSSGSSSRSGSFSGGGGTSGGGGASGSW
jgi:uncharacterized protein